MVDVELWQQPINGGKNTLPVIKVEDKIFVYGRDGLHTYPANTMSRPVNWQKLGETVLRTADVCAKAFEIFTEKFPKFIADISNPVTYARAFADALVSSVQDLPIWDTLKNQDWSNAKIDMKIVLNANCASSRNSSYGSRSNVSTSNR